MLSIMNSTTSYEDNIDFPSTEVSILYKGMGILISECSLTQVNASHEHHFFNG